MLSEYLQSLPSDMIVSIGSKESSGWFYFGRAKNAIGMIEEMNNDIKKQYLHKYKYNLNQIKNLRNFLSNSERYNKMVKRTKKDKEGNKETFMDYYIKSDVYIYYWKELITRESKQKDLEDIYNNFVSIDEMSFHHFHKPIYGESIGILIDDLYMPGKYWYLKEWEDKYGKI